MWRDETDDDRVNGFVPVVASEHGELSSHFDAWEDDGRPTGDDSKWQNLWWLYFSEIASSHDQF